MENVRFSLVASGGVVRPAPSDDVGSLCLLLCFPTRTEVYSYVLWPVLIVNKGLYICRTVHMWDCTYCVLCVFCVYSAFNSILVI